MTVYCSYCSAGYLLPDHLMGPRGARVRCPRCGKTFVVLREPGAAATAEMPMEDAGTAAPSGAGTGPPEHEPAAERLAGELLDAIAARGGDRLSAARQRGRVLAEFGSELMRAYDEYRERLGPAASAHAFRRVLRDRWSVDLITGVER